MWGQNNVKYYSFGRISRLFVIVLLFVLVVVISLLAGGYAFFKQQKTQAAATFAQSFANQIQSQDTSDSFAKLDDSLKGDKNSNYYSWLFWSSSFKNEGVKINTPAQIANFTNPSIEHILGTGSIFDFTFTTSGPLKLSLTIIAAGSDWQVTDYRMVE